MAWFFDAHGPVNVTKPKPHTQTMTDAACIMRVQDGRVTWTSGGQLHRTDGPAVVTCDGQREWWVRGRRHRTDGPAIERPNGDHEWFHDGYKMFETDFHLYMKLLRSEAS